MSNENVLATKPNQLIKLFPQESKVNIVCKYFTREFVINKITLEVDAWLENEFGTLEKAASLIEGGNPTAIMKLFYKLLSNEDKIFLTDIKVKSEIDEDGISHDVTNNVQKLLRVLDVNNITEIFESLLKARGLSLPEKVPGKKKAQVRTK